MCCRTAFGILAFFSMDDLFKFSINPPVSRLEKNYTQITKV